MREDDGQEPTTLSHSLTFLINPGRRGASVVPISNVKNRNAGEGVLDGGDIRGLTNVPGSMAHPVFSDEINLGFAGDLFLDKLFQFTVRKKKKKNRAGLRIERLDVTRAVLKKTH